MRFPPASVPCPRRLAFLALLALLPFPLVALSLYRLESYQWAFLAYHLTCLGAFWAWGERGGGFRPKLAPYLVLALGFAAAATLVIPSFLDFGAVREAMGRFGYQTGHLPLLAAYFLVVHPFAEEAFWRGTLYAGLAKQLPQQVAALLSSTLFGAWHAVVLWALMPSLWWLGSLAAGCFGLAMVAVYRLNRRHLLPATVFHSLGGDLPLVLVLGFVFNGAL